MKISWLRIAVVVWLLTSSGSCIACEQASGHCRDGMLLFLACALQGLSWFVPVSTAWAQLKENTPTTAVPPQTATYGLLIAGLFLGALCGALSM